ncbi:hypothetical protein OHT52_22545 [Streptomyces sp. NBC_00247]|uniref:hypothetical protein n=1 Tax=Streptomyces sp. NBC_00247 TaxID=2975689 RepID=UPI002E2AA3C0|nr:hypothetical protein [Streptomyces sp. NBC_00247]
MDPITAAVLTALAGGVGGDLGRQAWQGLTALVRRPFRRGSADDVRAEPPPGISSGELEITELENDPADPLRAQALATALGVRAALDEEFRAALEEWWQAARSGAGDGVHNTISGGTQHGPVIQGRDFSNLTFHVPEHRDR